MKISERLTKLRKALGWNQIPFAKEMGVSARSYADYERGVKDMPLSLIMNLCDQHHVSADWLLLGKGSMENSDSFEILEAAVIATHEFIIENDLKSVPIDKEAKIVSLLYQDAINGKNIDKITMQRAFHLVC